MASEGFNDGSEVAKQAKQRREQGLLPYVLQLVEHVARLEEKLEAGQRDTRERLDAASRQRAEQSAEIAKLREELARIKGVWGGVVLCFSLIGALLALFRAQLAAAIGRLFK